MSVSTAEEFFKKNQEEEQVLNIVQTKRGQLRRYGDEYNEYKIISRIPENEIKNFCLEVLYSCKNSEQKESFPECLEPYYSFKKVKTENYISEYIYLVTHPNCD